MSDARDAAPARWELLPVPKVSVKDPDYPRRMVDLGSDAIDSALDVSDFTVKTTLCADCQQHHARVTGYVSRGPTTLTAYYAVCHGHPHHEVSLDLMFGTWGSGDPTDHETFSCILRPDGAMVVDPFVTVSLDPRGEVPAILGRAVPRAEALEHPLLSQLWEVIDALVLGVAPISEQYHSR